MKGEERGSKGQERGSMGQERGSNKVQGKAKKQTQGRGPIQKERQKIFEDQKKWFTNFKNDSKNSLSRRPRTHPSYSTSLSYPFSRGVSSKRHKT